MPKACVSPMMPRKRPPSPALPRANGGGVDLFETGGDKRSRLLFQDQKPAAASRFRLTQLHNRKSVHIADEVHKSIDVTPVAKALIDTPQFQRLRRIKQLGTAFLVYPCGDHNRFQHSLGVMRLAETLCERLQKSQPWLQTSSKDVLCVSLAGLLHDLGHGPFSHVYEMFRAEIDRDIANDVQLQQRYAQFEEVPDDFDHEDASLMMIDEALKHLGLAISYKESRLDEPLEQIGDGVDARSMRNFLGQQSDVDILTNRDFIFIKECIVGRPIYRLEREISGTENMLVRIHGKASENNSKFFGRVDRYKHFLYCIVHNIFTGLDVDKLDYFARDERRCLVSGEVEIPVMKDAVVARAHCSESDCNCKSHDDGNLHCMICYPDKVAFSAARVFSERYRLHNTIYQHNTVSASTRMLIDAMKLADLHLASELNGYPLSRAVLDPAAYQKSTDEVLAMIKFCKKPELREAQHLCQRFENRKLYKPAGELRLNTSKPQHRRVLLAVKEDPKLIVSELLHIHANYCESDSPHRLAERDIAVDLITIHYGNKETNPISMLRFVNGEHDVRNVLPEDLPKARELDPKTISCPLPSEGFLQHKIRVYYTGDNEEDPKRSTLRQVFAAWDIGLQESTGQATPLEADTALYDEGNDYYNENQHATLLSQESDSE